MDQEPTINKARPYQTFKKKNPSFLFQDKFLNIQNTLFNIPYVNGQLATGETETKNW